MGTSLGIFQMSLRENRLKQELKALLMFRKDGGLISDAVLKLETTFHLIHHV